MLCDFLMVLLLKQWKCSYCTGQVVLCYLKRFLFFFENAVLLTSQFQKPEAFLNCNHLIL